MGSRNANKRRGVDSTKAEEVEREIPARQLATGYAVDDLDTDDKTMRLMIHRSGRPLGYLYIDSDEAYELAHLILRKYDLLEGIK
jgi:hypothetical protein